MIVGKRCIVLVVCLVTALALTVGLDRAAAQVIFQEDWENGLAGWDGPSNPSAMFITTDLHRAGSHSLRAVYPPGSEVSAGTIKKFFGTGYDELYVRWYQYFSQGWVWHTTATKLSILTPYDPHRVGGPGPNLYINGMWGNAQPMIAMQYMADQNYDSVNFYQNVGAPVALQNGRWYCLEVQAKLNTPGRADGLFRMWIDNELKLEYVNRSLRGADPYAPAPSTAKWDYLDIATNYAGDRSYEVSRWHDSLVISTQRVGCLDAPAPSGAAVPAPPSNVRVVP